MERAASFRRKAPADDPLVEQHDASLRHYGATAAKLPCERIMASRKGSALAARVTRSESGVQSVDG